MEDFDREGTYIFPAQERKALIRSPASSVGLGEGGEKGNIVQFRVELSCRKKKKMKKRKAKSESKTSYLAYLRMGKDMRERKNKSPAWKKGGESVCFGRNFVKREKGEGGQKSHNF